MSILVPIALFGWIPAVLLMFALLPPRRAVITAFLAAWLFLPVAGYEIPGPLPNYNKMTATSLGVLLGVFLFDGTRLWNYRFRWVDIPMVAWCICPALSSLDNGLGVYDALSGLSYQCITWGLPYFLGRLYFSDFQGMATLARGLLIGGLIYVPLCLFEIRMSPQLHAMVYGYHQHSFAQTMRFGGFRPTVFMQHGLMLGMWMTAASLVGLWLWRARSVRSIGGLHVQWLLAPLLLTTVLCKSAGALALLAVGLGVLAASQWLRVSIPLLVLLMVPPLYAAGRSTHSWSGRELVAITDSLVGGERAGSLRTRLDNEDLLTAKAMQRPIFGWGGWGRARVYNESGHDVTVTDGLWIIVLGNYGVFGLASLLALILLPGFLLWWRVPVRRWTAPELAPTAAVAVLLVLYMIDNLANAMVNPVFTVALGGASGVLAVAQNLAPRSGVARALHSPMPQVGQLPVRPAGAAPLMPSDVGRSAEGVL